MGMGIFFHFNVLPPYSLSSQGDYMKTLRNNSKYSILADFGKQGGISCGKCWKKFRPILFGTILLVLIFVPACLPNILMSILSKEKVYLYRQIEEKTSQNLLILEVLSVPQTLMTKMKE